MNSCDLYSITWYTLIVVRSIHFCFANEFIFFFYFLSFFFCILLFSVITLLSISVIRWSPFARNFQVSLHPVEQQYRDQTVLTERAWWQENKADLRNAWITKISTIKCLNCFKPRFKIPTIYPDISTISRKNWNFDIKINITA